MIENIISFMKKGVDVYPKLFILQTRITKLLFSAEQAAEEIKAMQGRLTDYNLVIISTFITVNYLFKIVIKNKIISNN
jgi:hypothetical protein